NKINAIFEDSQGRFWVGTDGGGLNQMDRATGTFEAITEKDGLKGNSIKGITESNHGELWISTNKGLNRLD
ncbi:MAG: two-component regulator propeller domain-containing protein, partial [Flammeovirgaceae bacterium]